MEVNTSAIVLSERGELSYPAEVEKILNSLRQQGFRDFKVELKTCYERSNNCDCYGKQGWRITYPAKEPYRAPWESWYFPKGIEDKSVAVEVEIEVLEPIIEKSTSTIADSVAASVDVDCVDTTIRVLPATQDSDV